MRTRRVLGDLLVHSQLFIAFSGACFVCAFSLLLVGRFPPPILVLAAFCGILAIHLIDSVRSASREDTISQPRRAKLYRAWRIPALVISVVLLTLTGVILFLVGAPVWVLGGFGVLGLLAASYVLPVLACFRESGPSSLKDFARLKPILISSAWITGALLVVFAQPSAFEDLSGTVSIPALVLTSFPLLLLDSVWLDHRDRRADESYARRTFAVRMSRSGFRALCLILYPIPLFGMLFQTTGLDGFIIGGLSGAFLLIVRDADQIGSESLRVVLAGLWRVTSLCGLLLCLG